MHRENDFSLKHILVSPTNYYLAQVSTNVACDCDWGTWGHLLFRRFLCEHRRTYRQGRPRDCAESYCDPSQVEEVPGTETKHCFRGETCDVDHPEIDFPMTPLIVFLEREMACGEVSEDSGHSTVRWLRLRFETFFLTFSITEKSPATWLTSCLLWFSSNRRGLERS